MMLNPGFKNFNRPRSTATGAGFFIHSARLVQRKLIRLSWNILLVA
jgi:hypothetical protein